MDTMVSAQKILKIGTIIKEILPFQQKSLRAATDHDKTENPGGRSVHRGFCRNSGASYFINNIFPV